MWSTAQRKWKIKGKREQNYYYSLTKNYFFRRILTQNMILPSFTINIRQIMQKV